MKKILTVCLGNICRSPMAEGIIKEEFLRHGIPVQVDSAGTAAFHVGEGADRRAQAELKKHGIDISNERAQKFVPQYFQEYDLILAMDSQNYRDIIMQTDREDELEKVKMIMNYVYPGENISVPDPYYGGDAGFANVYKMLKSAAEELVNIES